MTLANTHMTLGEYDDCPHRGVRVQPTLNTLDKIRQIMLQ